jgi:hypothetical protein
MLQPSPLAPCPFLPLASSAVPCAPNQNKQHRVFFTEARRIPPQYQEIRRNIENSCSRYFASSLDAPQSGGPFPPVRILWSVGYPQSSIDRELRIPLSELKTSLLRMLAGSLGLLYVTQIT